VKLVVLALVILTLGGERGAVCRRSPETGAGGVTRSMPDTVTLSAANPEARLPLSLASLVSNASVLTFSVLAVDNPKKLPVEIAVGLGGGGAEATREIGRIALFPPDQPGRFALRIPPEIRKLLAQRTAQTYSLVISLVHDQARGVDGRQVTIGMITWSAGPE
jgi:hypothetical protein